LALQNRIDHIPLQEATNLVIERLRTQGLKVSFEDDDKDFKDFFGTGYRLFEEAFCSLEIVLFELEYENGSKAGLEFHVFSYTRKGRKLQRSLSKNHFQKLKVFLGENVFSPAGLKVLEYDPPERDYEGAKRSQALFPDRTPGVIIHIGGWLIS